MGMVAKCVSISSESHIADMLASINGGHTPLERPYSISIFISYHSKLQETITEWLQAMLTSSRP
jgi:hypothetical protein